MDSTQKRLLHDLKSGLVTPPIAYFTDHQLAGIGSRGNEWIGLEGNFFLSFAITKKELPADLPVQSLSIYVSFLLKMVLQRQGSKVWIKWPNDFYIDQKKCGGCVTNMIGDVFVCGIGLNIQQSPEGFGVLDIEVDPEEVLGDYFLLLKEKPSWKEIFSKFRIEFQKSRTHCTHIGSRRVSLRDARLAEDGALIIAEERVYSVR